MAVGPCCSYY